MHRITTSLIILTIFLAIAQACTIGLIMGETSVSGRPIIFKNRDISSTDLEFETYNPSDGYHYAYNSYISSSTAWMGVNEAGFGCVQSASYNISSEGGSGLGNGNLINFVLRNCETVSDFERILDSTDVTGRSTAANYAVFDAYGDGAIYECKNWEHMKYDPDENGIITRGNFSYIGDTRRRGEERMNRAHDLLTTAFEGDSLDPAFVGMYVVADLERTGNDPYPLPFSGTFPGCPAGWVDCDSSNIETINNEQTMCCGVIQGVAPGENTDLSHMYCYFACPAVSVPFVIFPASETQPEEGRGYDGELRSLCFTRHDEAFHSYDETLFDTQALVNSSGPGIWDYSRPINRWVYDTVAAQIEIWELAPPSSTDLENFQDYIMDHVLFAYENEFEVGIDENETILPARIEFAAYPNPFNSTLNLDLPENVSSIDITDIQGNLIERITGNAWQPSSNTPSGFYMINVKTQSGDDFISRVLYLK